MQKIMSDEQRAAHRTRIQAAIDRMTPEEDAAITKAALDDPDTVLVTDEFTKGRPGRPFGEITKKPISIRLSPDVLDYFRATGPGWQSRIDDVLRKAAGLKKRA
jgi:uncharacterized protein (DUF4415 family)